MKKILLVDLFKGVAIINIIIVHSAQIYNLPDFVKSITNFGQMGCQMFFLMSITGSFAWFYLTKMAVIIMLNRLMKQLFWLTI